MNPDTPHQSESNSLLNALRVLRERWWVVVLSVLTCAGVALAVSLSSTKEYDATARLVFGQSGLASAVSPGTEGFFQFGIDPERDAATNLSLGTSTEVSERARRILGTNTPADDLADQVTIETESGANIMKITARDPDPKVAAAIATAFADAFIQYRQDQIARDAEITRGRLTDQLDKLERGDPKRSSLEDALARVTLITASPTANAEVIDRPAPPSTPAVPRPKRDALVAGILGLALGLVVAFLVDLFDRRVKTTEEFERIYDLRALSTVPRWAAKPGEKGWEAAFEQYRILRNNIPSLALPNHEVKVVMVTSPVLGDGKTTVAANLARAIAVAGQRVALVEADLHRPSLLNHFKDRVGADTGGLSAVLLGRQTLDQVAQAASDPPWDLDVILSGPLPPNSAELLESRRTDEVLRQLTDQYDMVILDAPPLLPVADAQILLDHPMVDACVVVSRAFHTTRRDIRRARAILERHRMSTMGLVITGVTDSVGRQPYGLYRTKGIPKTDDNGQAPALPAPRSDRVRPRQGATPR
jgi:receptor protein-tyrosine kinase